MFPFLIIGLRFQLSHFQLSGTVGVSPGIPGSSVGPVQSSSTHCCSDELDMTLGALARQLGSSVTAGPHGGEGYSPRGHEEQEDRMQQRTSGVTGGEFQKTSPRFSDLLPGFGQTFGAQESSPVPKRGEYIVWL